MYIGGKHFEGINILTAILLAVLTVLVILPGSLHSENFFLIMLHNVNLTFHEAGHTIFFFTGQFFSILAGSLMQIFIPFLFVIAFLKEGSTRAMLVCLWWMGENFWDVSFYIADASTRALTLLGGDAVVHDWWYILSVTGNLQYDHLLASAFQYVGFMLMGVAVVTLLAPQGWSRKKDEDD